MQLPAQLDQLYRQALEIWLDGGWAMIAIAAVAVVMFAVGMNIYLRLTGKGFEFVRERRWRTWIDEPGQRRGPIGRLLDFVSDAKTIEQVGLYFNELRSIEVNPFKRDLLVMRVCVAAAPLLGLLGTVTGMVATFDALNQGSGGDETQQMVADGISVALITTETGLVIALVGLFFQYQLARKHQRYQAFIAHLETVYTQTVYHRGLKAGNH